MNKPTLSIEDALKYAGNTDDALFILGVRGFTAAVGENKRGVYDDAIFIVDSDHGAVIGFPGNTDPSITKPGMAVLQDGDYKYRQGLHGMHHLDLTLLSDKHLYDTLIGTKRDLPPIPGRTLPYWALRQAGPVKVLRDGAAQPETDKWPQDPDWIDIHDGGRWTTSSAGCQTIPPGYWYTFKALAYSAMDKAGLTDITYKLRTI